MITLNLLSLEQKNQFRIKRAYLLCKELIMLVLLFAAIAGILLTISRYVLEQQLVGLLERNALTVHTSEATDQKIIRLNNRLEAIKTITKDFYPWSTINEEIANITPEGISYTTIRIFPKELTLEIQGTAIDRQTLLALKQALEKSPYFTNIDLPLTALIERERSNFTIKATINKIP